MKRDEYIKRIVRECFDSDNLSDMESVNLLNEKLAKKNITLTIGEIIDIIFTSYRITNIFDEKKNYILSGDFEIFKNNKFLYDAIIVYYMISNYDINNDLEGFKEEIDKLTPEMKKLYQYANTIKKVNKYEESDLMLKAQKEDLEAKNRIVELYLKYIFKLAYFYLLRCKELSFEDIVQEGCAGVLTGIKTYDVSKNCNSHIKSSINFSMLLAWKNRANYYHKREECFSKYKKAFIEKYGRKPTIEELYGFIYSTNNEIVKYLERGKKQVIEVQDSSVNIEETIVNNDCIDVFNSVYPYLKEREKTILELRFGLNGNVLMTLEEIGNRYGLTRERVRQIEKNALVKVEKIYNGYDVNKLFKIEEQDENNDEKLLVKNKK